MQTYLSAVPVHLLAKPTRYRAHSADDYHRDVMSLFPSFEGNPRQSGNILFRIERLERQAPQFLIRSTCEPVNKTDIIRSKQEPDYTATEGQLVSFRLSINAIRRDKTGKAIPVEADGIEPGTVFYDWLAEKLGGFLTDIELITHNRDLLGANRRGTNDKAGKVIQVDTVDGIARVHNGAALQEVIVSGIGRAKSYGCGLLTVRVLA